MTASPQILLTSTTSGPIVPSWTGNDQSLSPRISLADLTFAPVFASMMESLLSRGLNVAAHAGCGSKAGAAPSIRLYCRSARKCALQENRLESLFPLAGLTALVWAWLDQLGAALIVKTCQAFRFTQDCQHFKDSGRRCPAGQRAPHRLRDGAQFDAALLGERSYRLFGGFGGPWFHAAELVGNFAEHRPGFRREQRRRFVVETERAVGK